MRAGPAADDLDARHTPDPRAPEAVGHVVLAEGGNGRGRCRLALWHLGPTGRPTGAWLGTTADESEHLLQLVHRRVVVARTPRIALVTLGGLAAAAGSPEPAPVFLDLAAVLAEIADHRRRVEAASAAPVDWPTPVPATVADLAAGLPATHAGAGLAAEALQLSRLVVTAANLWRETESARLRRRHLAHRFGPPAALPPGWLATLRMASRVDSARPE